MEGCRGIALTEQHDHGFEEPEGRLECGLPLIAISDADVMVPPLNVEFRKEAFPSEISRQGSDIGERVDVPDCPCIQRSVILNQSEGAILLFDEEEQGRVGGF